MADYPQAPYSDMVIISLLICWFNDTD
jgi:hypothetical protein